MERWIDGEPLPIALPGQKEPETLWGIIQMSEDEINRYAGVLENYRTAQKGRGKDLLSQEVIDEETEMDRESTAAKIVWVRNGLELGDEITDKKIIKDLLAKLPARRYEMLRQLILGTSFLTPFERKV